LLRLLIALCADTLVALYFGWQSTVALAQTGTPDSMVPFAGFAFWPPFPSVPGLLDMDIPAKRGASPYWDMMPMSRKGSESTHARCTGAIGSAQLQVTVRGDWLPAAPPSSGGPRARDGGAGVAAVALECHGVVRHYHQHLG
jgi:hypothetical protein